MAPTDLLSAGAVFAGRFRVVELLGRGEMGATYAVDPLPGGQRCALKVMNAALARTPSWRGRFATDARRTSMVASPHVLQTLDAGIDSATGQPWFTTELLRGEDLSARVSREARLPLTDVRLLVIALADALGEAHSQRLVHYDLTPENVHLGPGSPFTVRLRELTISRLISDACAAEGDLIGTAIWMPPEQFELGRPLSPGANVWSLGLLAFFVATGISYWVNASDEPAPSKELLREILSDPLAPASERARVLGCAGMLPRRFDAWFARCLTRNPRERFADAHAANSAFHRMDRPDSVAPAPAEAPTLPTLPAPALAAPLPAATPTISPTPPAAATSVAAAPPAPRETKRRAGSRWRVAASAVMSAAFGLWLWNDGSARRQAATSAAPPASTAVAHSATVSASATPSTSIAPAPSVSPPVASSAVVFAESPPAVDAGDVLEGFDLPSALKALNRVYYGDCHVPSAGVLAITFGASGRVKRVALVQGGYDEQTSGCIFARFGAATTAPFRGVPQTVTANIVATP